MSTDPAAGMRVVLATDGSEAAEVALDLAASITWPAGSVIRLVSAVEPMEAALAGAWAPVLARDLDDQLDELAVAAREVLEHAARRVGPSGATIERAVPRGRASTVIVSEAQAMDAHMIMLGSRGHGRIGSMLLGSVSAEVVDHSTRPVLVARVPRLTRVILGTDGSSFARAAEEVLAGWPIFRQAAIEATSVAHLGLPWTSSLALSADVPSGGEYGEMGSQVIADHQRLADEAARRLSQASLRASARVVEGDAAAELVRIARDDQADLIVVGTHGRTGLDRLITGSVARNVMHHAPCSVLIVRTPPAVPD